MAKVQTLKVSFGISRHVNRDRFTGRDESERVKPLGCRIVVVNALRGASRREGESVPQNVPEVCIEVASRCDKFL